MYELRQALGEQAQKPQFIETVRGRGYRFIAPVTPEPMPRAGHDSMSATPPPQPATESAGHQIIGRDAELLQLHQWFETALQGERQIGFVTGEAGIGKTTLLEAFLAEIASEALPWVGHGQCLEQYGAGEAYMPLLEALGRLCRGAHGAMLVVLLKEQAPSWLAQLPAQLPMSEREAFYLQGHGATQERMLRELAEAVEVMTTHHPLILVLEDLHWCDPSTLEWLAYMARRRDPARLLILATYRPIDAIVREHPVHSLIQELRLRGQCRILDLDYWSEAEVGAFVAQRFTGVRLPTEGARILHRRTSGNPLFVGAVVEEFVRQGLFQLDGESEDGTGGADELAVAIPDSLRQLIEQQMTQLTPEEQELLEAASVAGIEFSIAAVETVVETSATQLEARYADLAKRHQFVRTDGLETWPDGTAAARYRFIHALYQEVVYARVSPGRGLRLHQQIGARKEVGYGDRAREIASELATHFVHGHDHPRAVQYLHLAGENALWRGAHQEAMTHLVQSLTFLHTLPETRERMQQEVGLQSTLGLALQVIKGTTSPEVEQAYTRAYDLCQQLGDTETLQLLPVLRGLFHFYTNRMKRKPALTFGKAFLSLAQRSQQPIYLLQAHASMGNMTLWLGDFVQARTYCQEGIALYDAQLHRTETSIYGENPKVHPLGVIARAQWYLGYPEQALQQIQQAYTIAEESGNSPSLAFAQYHMTVVHRNRRDPYETIDAQVRKLMAMYPAPAFALWEPVGLVELGWLQVAQGLSQEGLRQMHEGLAALATLKADIFRPAFLFLLADAYGIAGQSDEGLRRLAEAQEAMETTEMYYMAAEITRLRGQLLLQQGTESADQAEVCFHQALDTARRQQAKSWELRVAISLGRLWQQQGKQDEAYTLLAPIYDWFTEGLDTADLQDAKALLDELQP